MPSTYIKCKACVRVCLSTELDDDGFCMRCCDQSLRHTVVLLRNELQLKQLELDSQVPLLLEAVQENLTRAIKAEKGVVMVEFNFDVAMEQFKKRKEENSKKKRVDNAAAPAGAPMVYYCKYCGDHTETLPETHFQAPKTTCGPCKPLVDHGLVK